MKKSIIFLTIVNACIFFSCEKQIELEENTKAKSNYIINQFNYSTKENSDLEVFTFAVNEALKEKTFRLNLKEKAMKQFDGDYNVLLNFNNKSNYNEIESSILKALKDRNGGKKLNFNAELFLKNIKINNPLLQLSIPIHCEEWDAENYIPATTFLPIGFDENEKWSLKGYKSDGTLIWFDKENEPANPVVVICENERSNAGEQKSGDPDAPPPDDPDDGDGGSGGADPREDGDLEIVEKFYFSDLNAVEPWIMGKPEIRLRVFAGSGGGELASVFWKPKRSDVANTWYNVNNGLFHWYIANYGNFLIFRWIEEDNGGTINVNFTYQYQGTTTTINYTMNENDDEIGGSVIGHSDPWTTQYNVGIFKWQDYY